MALEIRYQQSNFAQFSDVMWMLATDGDATIKFDVEQHEILGFALHLCDVAYDCLTDFEADTDDADDKLSDSKEKLSEAMESIQSIPEND